MNFPVWGGDLPDAPEPPDLQFDDQLDNNRKLSILDENGKQSHQGLKAETLPVPEGYSEAQAEVGCYDWGAYGELMAMAEMPDGRQIVGYLKTDNTNPYIRIPKRKEGSLIADAWREQWRDEVPDIFKLADDDDSEVDPKPAREHPGPGWDPDFVCKGGHKGDGLTLYEEYRGFYVAGQHVWGHPGKKDLFILNRGGGDSESGVMHLRSLTQEFMEVHSGLREDEIGPKQIVDFSPDSGLPDAVTHGQQVWINANVSIYTPSHGKQYGICIHTISTGANGWSWGMGRPGKPKKVALDPDIYHSNEFRTGTGAIVRFAHYRTISHELLHCCNVRHHGDVDKGMVSWTVKGDNLVETSLDRNGNPIPDNTEIIPLTNLLWKEGDTAYVVSLEKLKSWLSEAKDAKEKNGQVWVANQGGQHSGYQDCVMRYKGAAAYIPRPDSKFRYLNPHTGELTGYSLCDQKEDSAVPSLQLPKVNRYGDASAGYCRSQICINDNSPDHKPK
jgi:hypothetical protein